MGTADDFGDKFRHSKFDVKLDCVDDRSKLNVAKIMNRLVFHRSENGSGGCDETERRLGCMSAL